MAPVRVQAPFRATFGESWYMFANCAFLSAWVSGVQKSQATALW